jgi:hypothetical protein
MVDLSPPFEPERLLNDVMTMTPAPQAPFAVDDAVRFLADPDHVERVVECQWIFGQASRHWRVTTAWTDEGGKHIRVGDAAEFTSLGCSSQAS